MKMYKEDSPIELALQEVEEVLRKHNMEILWEYGFRVTMKDTAGGKILDAENGEVTTMLPRMVDSERICLDT